VPNRVIAVTRRVLVRAGVAGRVTPVAFGVVSERISRADIEHVARLARLELEAGEIDDLTERLGAMLDHFADVDELDLHDVVPMTQPYPLVNVLRDDVVEPGLDRDEVLAAAPDAADGRFRVPPIVGLDG
jgi:aspartyl-tRNA(Asn)/glutamyl-tRNA(Gln) amidotransferase subunit C